VLNNLIYVLSNFKNGLIFIQEDKQLSEHSKIATRNHIIVPQDFDPVYTSRNKRLVHKTISNIMKAGSGPLGASKVHQLRKVANERKNEVPLIEDDEIRDFLREGT
jgi:hypothetical protein